MKSYTYLLTVESMGEPTAADVAKDATASLKDMTPPYQVQPLELFSLAGQPAFMCSIASPYGQAVWVCASEAGATHQAAEYARRHWRETADTEEGRAVMPRVPDGLPDLEAAQLFFTASNTEGFTIRPLTVRA